MYYVYADAIIKTEEYVLSATTMPSCKIQQELFPFIEKVASELFDFILQERNYKNIIVVG